ncbi:MAG: SAM-dependent methyltransferase [Cytophagales bacterium]|nr:SAM-dependent methyltransferase [Cytophagales bacterium]
MDNSFRNFLVKLGFSDQELPQDLVENVYDHLVGKDHSVSVKYIYTPSEPDIFKQHQLLWNRNSDPVFIAVSGSQSHLINVKEKPDKDRPLKNSICIKSFNYGVNSEGFENADIELISKNSVESAYFFDFVSKNQRKRQPVDKDLLLNLLALKNDLIERGNEKTVHLLILRCLFIKYLEDRAIFEKDYLINILESQDANGLKNAFDQVARINGDVFKFDQFEVTDIRPEYLDQLSVFFRSDYRSSQLNLFFPYKFDEIPIQLISHVYEAFLKGSAKKGKGIYYTPAFLVNFMLSQSFSEKIKHNPKARVLDPAVGSGAFLVEAFKMIQKAYGGKLNFNAKKKILEEQLFGIDVDTNALQIAAFSLYLALLETEDPEFIKKEIERANPILPSLIGKTLIHGNTIVDDIFPDSVFDCIVSNPPWGSVPTESMETYQKEREAIDNKRGDYMEYKHVADYERSQAFLTRVSKWGDEDTLFVMVVKNSIFLNDNARNFRYGLLKRYQVNIFYELSHYNKILFKKSSIGRVNDERIELGASEPCVVLIFQQKSENKNIIKYISPKLTDFSEHFEILHYGSQDSFELKRSDFLEKDSLWKVLVNSDVEGHDLIVNKLQKQKELDIEVRVGLQPQKEMKSLGTPDWQQIIEPSDFEQFYQTNPVLGKFNWNQNLRRKPNESIFKGARIVIPVRPLKSDRFLFRGLALEEKIFHKDNILSIKIKNDNNYLNNYLPYLGIINSKLIGFLFFQLSTQWGKGEGKRDTLRNIDIEQLPLKEINDQRIFDQMTDLVKVIQEKKSHDLNCQYEIDRLNEMVFDLYGLFDYEKEIIREFYDVRVNRAGLQLSKVNIEDIQKYYEAFRDTFSLLLSKENSLKVSYHISSNMGVVICISIVSNTEATKPERNPNLEILNFVKSKQLRKSDSLKILFEEKVKIYDNDKFYIIKSNQFKDWTVRQAIRDAKEEMELFINQLSPVK